MLRFLPLVLLCGCVTTHDPQVTDTEFDPSRRDWAQVFVHEIKVAAENEDYAAYYFFMQELLKEDFRRKNNGKEMDANPKLHFYRKNLDKP